MDQLLTIGAFARRSRLSMKALRLYDRFGLLPPAKVDEATGYRYYLESQLERRVAGQRELAAYLQGELTFEVFQRDVPEQLALTEQRHVLVDELSCWLGRAMPRLMASARPAGFPFVVYHGIVDEDNDGPVEICVPVADAGPDLATRVEPAHREAYVRLRKAQVEFPATRSATSPTRSLS